MSDRLKRKIEETAALQVGRRNRGGVHDRMGLSARGTADPFVEAQMTEQPPQVTPAMAGGQTDNQDVIVQPTTPPDSEIAAPGETPGETPETDPNDVETDVDEEMKRALFNTLSELVDLGRIGRNEEDIRGYVDEHEDEIGELMDVLDDVVDMLIGEGSILREPKTFDLGDEEQPSDETAAFDEIKGGSGQQVPQGGTTTTVIASDQTRSGKGRVAESLISKITSGADIDATLERAAADEAVVGPAELVAGPNVGQQSTVRSEDEGDVDDIKARFHKMSKKSKAHGGSLAKYGAASGDGHWFYVTGGYSSPDHVEAHNHGPDGEEEVRKAVADAYEQYPDDADKVKPVAIQAMDEYEAGQKYKAMKAAGELDEGYQSWTRPNMQVRSAMGEDEEARVEWTVGGQSQFLGFESVEAARDHARDLKDLGYKGVKLTEALTSYFVGQMGRGGKPRVTQAADKAAGKKQVSMSRANNPQSKPMLVRATSAERAMRKYGKKTGVETPTQTAKAADAEQPTRGQAMGSPTEIPKNIAKAAVNFPSQAYGAAKKVGGFVKGLFKGGGDRPSKADPRLGIHKGDAPMTDDPEAAAAPAEAPGARPSAAAVGSAPEKKAETAFADNNDALKVLTGATPANPETGQTVDAAVAFLKTQGYGDDVISQFQQKYGGSGNTGEAVESVVRRGITEVARGGTDFAWGFARDLVELGYDDVLVEELNVTRTGMAVEVVFGDKAQAATSKGALLQYKGIDTVKEVGNGTLVVFTTDIDAEEARNRVTTILQNARVPMESFRVTRYSKIVESGQSAVGAPVPGISRGYNGPDLMPVPIHGTGGSKGASEDAGTATKASPKCRCGGSYGDDDICISCKRLRPGSHRRVDKRMGPKEDDTAVTPDNPFGRDYPGEIGGDTSKTHKGFPVWHYYVDSVIETLPIERGAMDALAKAAPNAYQTPVRLEDVWDQLDDSVKDEIAQAWAQDTGNSLEEQTGPQDPEDKTKFMQPFYAPDEGDIPEGPQAIPEPGDEPLDALDAPEDLEDAPGDDKWRMGVPEDPDEYDRLSQALDAAREEGILASWDEVGGLEEPEDETYDDTDMDVDDGLYDPEEAPPEGEEPLPGEEPRMPVGEAAGDYDEMPREAPPVDDVAAAMGGEELPGELDGDMGGEMDETPPEEDESYISVEFAAETTDEQRENFPQWVADQTGDPETGEGAVEIVGWGADVPDDEMGDEISQEIDEIPDGDSPESFGDSSDDFGGDLIPAAGFGGPDEEIVPEEKLLGEDAERLRIIHTAARVAHARGDKASYKRFTEALRRFGVERGLNEAAMTSIMGEGVTWSPEEDKIARKQPVPTGLPREILKLAEDYEEAKAQGDSDLADRIKGELEFQAGILGVDASQALEGCKVPPQFRSKADNKAAKAKRAKRKKKSKE